MQTLFESPKYKSFVQDRDKALEQIHLNTQLDLSRMVFDFLERIEGFVAKQIVQHNPNVHTLNLLSNQLDVFIQHQIGNMFASFLKRIESMRQNVFLLTYASEAEAIGRATQKQLTSSPQMFQFKITQAKSAQTIHDQDLTKRVWLAFYKLKSRIIQAFNLALVQELTPQETLDKVKGAFPKLQTYQRPPRELKPIREAGFDPNDPDQKQFLDLSFVSDTDWNLAVQAYKDTELSPTRFDQSLATSGPFAQYNWELEQDVTDDFVKQVRDGQVQAANDLGIKDFVWVAIIDDKTDECCLKRSGHTSQEIQKMLDNGKLKPEVCDAVTAPAHPSCRCQMAPVASVNQVEGPDWKSFGDWLNS